MKRFVTLACALLMIGFSTAQDDGGATLEVAENDRYGTHLVTGDGMSIYQYREDEQGSETSACTGSCTRNWPPVVVDEEPVAGEGVDAEMMGTLERADGTTQVTYNGWPLYTYARDTAPGDIKGAGLGGAFFLLSPEGEPLTEELAQEATQVDDEVMAELMSTGEQAYANNCAVCHGPEGQGAVGPGLAGNSFVGNDGAFVRQIVNGSPAHGMPPFGHLPNEEIAAIATFVRNSWSNDFGPITPEQVEEFR